MTLSLCGTNQEISLFMQILELTMYCTGQIMIIMLFLTAHLNFFWSLNKGKEVLKSYVYIIMSISA